MVLMSLPLEEERGETELLQTVLVLVAWLTCSTCHMAPVRRQSSLGYTLTFVVIAETLIRFDTMIHRRPTLYNTLSSAESFLIFFPQNRFGHLLNASIVFFGILLRGHDF